MKNDFNFKNARFSEQLNKMKEMHKLGICMFCKEGMKKYHGAPILREKKWWFVTKNDYPYEGTKVHILIAYKKHIDSINNISSGAMTELLGHIKWIIKKYKMPGGVFAMRFGDTNYTGATIKHLHAHIILGASREKLGKVKYPDSFITSVLGYKIKK